MRSLLLNEYLGPVIISITRVFRDIFRVVLIYLIVWGAHAMPCNLCDARHAGGEAVPPATLINLCIPLQSLIAPAARRHHGSKL